MSAQLDFFAAPTKRPMLAHQRTSRTSKAAAVKAEPNAAAQRARVLAWIRQQPNGATRQEVSMGLGVPINSICPRFGELLKAGAIRETGKTRPTISGRAAEVVEAVK
jgi:hypothetical protein